jgi:tetratricopeptide (TPR) repeat protein
MSDTSNRRGLVAEAPLDPALEVLLCELVDDWMAGTPRPLRAYLDRRPDLAGRREAVIELVNQEVVLRQARGETPRPVDYLAEFPEWTESLERLFEVHALTSGDGDPDHRTAIQSLSEGSLVPAPAGAGLPQVPGYEIERYLGRGGMGIVYLARHQGLNRKVALKLLQESRQDDPGLVARFRREAEAAARCQHPNLVQIHDVGEHDGELYLALEYVAGGHLGRTLAGRPQRPRRAAELVETLARAIEHAHAQGVVHRDLKPANVLLGPNGQPKITDFGLAKLKDSPTQTELGVVVGTLAYMAPEQVRARSGEIGPRTDIHALGAILYEALTGRPPYRAETPERILHAILAEEVVPPSGRQPGVPRDLEAICLKCLEKEPTRRYATAADLAEDLRRFLDGRPTAARPASVAERCLRWCRRNRGAVAAMAALLLLTTFSAWQATRATQAERRAKADRDRAESEAEAAREVHEFFREILGQVAASNQVMLGRKPDPDIKHRAVLDRAAELIGDRFGRRPLSEAAIRLAIGEGYTELGLYPEARPHLERAVALRRDVLGANDPQTHVAMCRLGTLFLGDDRVDEARQYLVPAMEGLRVSRGLADRETLIAMKTVGRLYLNLWQRSQGNDLLPKGMDLLRQAEEGLRAVFGPDHPETLDATAGRAIGYLQQERSDDARRLLEDAIHRMEQSSRPEHPRVLEARTDLGTVFYILGMHGEAARTLEGVLAVQTQGIRTGHPSTLKTMAWLGASYVMMAVDPKAEPSVQEALKAKAESVLQEALKECRKALDRNHSTTETVLVNLAGLYSLKALAKKNGEYLKEVGEYLIEAAEIFRLHHGADDKMTDDANHAVSLFYSLNHHFFGADGSAAEPYARAHRDYCVRHTPDHIDRYLAEVHLCNCRLLLRDLPEAERSRIRAELIKSVDRIIELYQKAGDAENVKQWKLKRFELAFPDQPLAPK